MPLLCHLFPGVTPWGLRSLTIRDYLDLVTFATTTPGGDS